MKTDPILAAADLAIVAGHLREIRAVLREINAVPKVARLDRHALDAAIAAVVALAVDCDAATTSAPYIAHADAAANAARLFAVERDADDADDRAKARAANRAMRAAICDAAERGEIPTPPPRS